MINLIQEWLELSNICHQRSGMEHIMEQNLMSIHSERLVMNCLKSIQPGNIILYMYNQKVAYKIYNFRKKYPSDNISDEYLRNKYKRIETLLKSMKSKFFEDRPHCYQVLKERDEWITCLDKIEETEEYKEFVDRLHNNSITDESLVKYSKYHFKSSL